MQIRLRVWCWRLQHGSHVLLADLPADLPENLLADLLENLLGHVPATWRSGYCRSPVTPVTGFGRCSTAQPQTRLAMCRALTSSERGRPCPLVAACGLLLPPATSDHLVRNSLHSRHSFRNVLASGYDERVHRTTRLGSLHTSCATPVN